MRQQRLINGVRDEEETGTCIWWADSDTGGVVKGTGGTTPRREIYSRLDQTSGNEEGEAAPKP